MLLDIFAMAANPWRLLLMNVKMTIKRFQLMLDDRRTFR